MTRTAYHLGDNAEEIIKEAAKIAKPYVDKLDCNISVSRMETSKTFEEVLEMEPKTFHFIYRDMDFMGGQDYWEVGVSTFTTPAYFVWIRLSVKEGDGLVDKFELKEQKWT